MKAEPVLIENMLNAPVSKVWDALTDEKEMKKWYFDIPGFKPEKGFEFKFTAGTAEKTYLHLCKITELIPVKRIAYSWRFDGYTGNSLVTFELFEEGNRTRIELTHEGVESFPEDNPDLSKENFITGWNELIGKALKDFVEKI